ncbi:Fusaric acid resistance protein-like-domain-containing protein [Kalaharituber pfeilii]|nr:Fusaric acid resistance protein-like-domain-containing protein [Kalaharituber pfeilii]
MTSNAHAGNSGRHAFFKYPRQASLIIPSTGERVHIGEHENRERNFTLRITSDPEAAMTETTPLLSRSYASSLRNGDGQEYFLDEVMWDRIHQWKVALTNMMGSKNSKSIIKCTLAYFLGSLATFVAPIAAILGRSDGKHLVATIAVYFHPARTAGSMFEAMIYALAALFYSTFVAVTSMIVSCFFADRDLLELGHAVILVVFCAGGLGLIGWVKHKRASPTVSVACSLSSIYIITILTKEGFVQSGQFSLNKVSQVTTILFMAIFASGFVAFTFWPSSARDELRKSMVKSTDSFSTMLSMITRSFLTGSEEPLHHPQFREAATYHRSVFTSLSKQLVEAKYEHYVFGSEHQYRLERKLVDCMQQLAQHIGGLQSASKSQLTLLQQQTSGAVTPQAPIPTPHSSSESGPATLFTPPADVLSPLFTHSPPTPSTETPSMDAIPEVPEDRPDNQVNIFEQFIYHLGPPMKSLVYTLKTMLDNLPSSHGPDLTIAVNSKFRESLEKATKLYSEVRGKAIDTLYNRLRVISGCRDQKVEWAADIEEIAGCCGYFSYCLQEFSQEMIIFLDILEQMEDYQNHPTRSWNWLKFWRRFELGNKAERQGSQASIPPGRLPDMLKLPDATKTIPNVARDKPTPFSYRIWKALRVFRRDDVKFGIKVGGGAAIYALPAFLPSTRPIFSHWRGEWGLVSYMIVMSMTIGQTNSSGLLRVLGTIIGAALAVLAWVLFPANPYALSLFGCIIAMPCFHIILNWKQNTFGRFILLTYNLSCLYAYSLSVRDDDDDDDEGGINPIITEIAFHRFVSVIVGVAWGIFINRYIWPISARSRLRRGFSVFWFRMALIWKRDPLLSTIHSGADKHYMTLIEERALQKALLRLTSLISQAPSEYRLKGPFPVNDYKKLISANQSILDACHGMSMMISKDPVANAREADILNYTAVERRDLCARISHIFYVLASSIKIGFPLPETLPNTDRSKDRLLAKLFAYREKIRGEEGKSDEDFALMYAYVLVLGRVIEGLQECIHTLNSLYGVLEEEMLEI